ncbi:site-specific integrase [Mesorhizobium sp. M0195]|uniref:tyrosine-type recombinase/integrase n=1 Tax=Mesorhizobium sp. M0195 TaxID=2956910 RepID=UPI00333D89AD
MIYGTALPSGDFCDGIATVATPATSWSGCRLSWGTSIPPPPQSTSPLPPIYWKPPVSASSALRRRYRVEVGHEDRRQSHLPLFEHHLKAEKGLAPTSIRSYRDGIRLFLLFLATKNRRPISELELTDLTADNVRAFLAHLEAERGNNIRSRNHRLAMLHGFFAYAAGQEPMVLQEAERVAAIPRKRTQPAATYYIERDEVERLFDGLQRDGKLVTLDKALLMFMHNTGARATEVIGLTVNQLA